MIIYRFSKLEMIKGGREIKEIYTKQIANCEELKTSPLTKSLRRGIVISQNRIYTFRKKITAKVLFLVHFADNVV